MGITIYEQSLLRAMGTVVDADDTGLQVETEAGLVRARRAVSCLIEPAYGDRVLLAGEEDAELYVLAVLARPGPEPLCVKVTGDLTVGVKEGRFSVLAEQGVDLVSGEDLSLTSKLIRMRAPEGHVSIDHLVYAGAKILSRVRRIKLVGHILDAVLERISHRVKRAYRFVEETEHVRAGEIDLRADGAVNVRGESTVMFARKLVKLDGEQIHLG